MNKQNKTIVGGAVFLVILVIIFAVLNGGSNVPSGKYDAFAKCLADRGAVMYGAEWCGHCKENKAAFGDSFKFINYVECPDNTQVCTDNGIQSFPTWLVGTSTRIVGFEKDKTMQELASSTGCELPQ
jgi:hypothetical protein